ncbi:MAG: MFS transporter [Aestuariivirga sp.]
MINTSRITIARLAIAQSLYSCVTIITFATAGIVGLTIAPDRGFATLPLSCFALGSMVVTIPASFLMRRFGRKPVFIAGALASAMGAAIGAWAIVISSFPAFCLGIFLVGFFQATSTFYSFAASESARPEDRSLAISWVLAGGVVAAVAGTVIASRTSNLIPLYVFAGSYIAASLLSLGNLLVIATTYLPKPQAAEIAGPQRSWPKLLRQPRLVVAMASAIISYALMNLMMTAGPVAMALCGFDNSASGWVIQWHVLGMFIPSFFTGLLIKRFGVNLISALGMIILIGSAIAGLLGIQFTNFAVALILLGIGWNFGFIGGTTMLTECYTPAERAKVQGVNNFGIAVMITLASFSSGQMLGHWGWQSIPLVIFPFAVLVLMLIGFVGRKAGRFNESY